MGTLKGGIGILQNISNNDIEDSENFEYTKNYNNQGKILNIETVLN